MWVNGPKIDLKKLDYIKVKTRQLKHDEYFKEEPVTDYSKSIGLQSFSLFLHACFSIVTVKGRNHSKSGHFCPDLKMAGIRPDFNWLWASRLQIPFKIQTNWANQPLFDNSKYRLVQISDSHCSTIVQPTSALQPRQVNVNLTRQWSLNKVCLTTHRLAWSMLPVSC